MEKKEGNSEIKHFFDHIEVFVDKAIPPLVFVLVAILIIEFFFKTIAEEFALWITVADWTILSFFVVDLIFKYLHVRNIPRFIKYFWLDIIAVFPFFLVFNFFSAIAEMFRIGAVTEQAQKLLHGTVAVEKEGALIVQEFEKVAALQRTSRLTRIIKPITRLPRILKLIPHEARHRVKKHHEKKFYGRVKKASLSK